jgi:hypothetical protein
MYVYVGFEISERTSAPEGTLFNNNQKKLYLGFGSETYMVMESSFVEKDVMFLYYIHR